MKLRPRSFKESAFIKKKTLTFADKISNTHGLEKEEYHRLLQNAVATTYKKSSNEIARRINCKRIKYIKEANILDQVEVNGTANCFISLKSHKVNFLNHLARKLLTRLK